MFFKSFDKTQLWYNVSGQGSPIIFIPGLASDSTTWLQQKAHFEQTHQVILLDNRGCGESEAPPGPYLIETMAKDVVSLMSHLNLEKADIVGGSMGAMIATQLAFDHTEKINNLVLLTPFAKFNSRNRYWFEVTGNIVDKITFEEYMALVIISSFGCDSYADRKQLDSFCQYFIKPDFPPTPLGFTAQKEGCLLFDVSNQFNKISVRTLVIAAEDDFFTRARDVKDIADQIPNAEFHLMEKTGHTVNIEAPDRLNALIGDFLKS